MKNELKFVSVLSIGLLCLSACGGQGGSANPSSPEAAPTADVPGQPTVVENEASPYPHWSHPDFARPNYNWQWEKVKRVTCSAVDSRGVVYEVSDRGRDGIGFKVVISQVEDISIDRCHNDSRGDNGCHLRDCHPENN